MDKDLYIDCEWSLDQKIFLIGFCYNLKEKGQLYDHYVTLENFSRVLEKCDGYIYIYGPDIGMLEKFFGINIRKNFPCINLIKVFKDHIPELTSYKLKSIEEYHGIFRSTTRYKENIFKIFSDWKKPKRKKEILHYNMDDVINMYKVKQMVFRDHSIRNKYLESIVMKPK